MRKGLFIVLEGVDGAGTTTHTERLVRSLSANTPVHETREPTAGPVGALLRLILTGRLVTKGQLGAHAPSSRTMALMFAADRLDHLEAEIVPLLEDGVTVVCDRYYHSSLAYQSLTAAQGGDTLGWIREINRHARVPDLTLVLNVPAAVAAERRRRRGGREIFDDEPLQVRLGEFYAELHRHCPQEPIVHINADAPIDDVAAKILALVQERLRTR